MKVGKVRVEPKTKSIAALTPNRYTTSRTEFSGQSDIFLGITSCHETESSTNRTIASADLFPQEYRR